MFGREDGSVYAFILRALREMGERRTVAELTRLVIDCGSTAVKAMALLDAANITCNKNTIPKETLSPFVTSGVRVGTPAVTTRGFGKEEMVKIADLFIRYIANLTIICYNTM